ncbi:MAG: beta-lactamase family protein [Bacteroidales bacterium]|nr:beta-lactamase family protein [Bacteroidales bacterium]
MKTILSFLLIASSLYVQAQTQSLQTSPVLSAGNPKEQGMSSERLSRIDAMLTESVEKGEIPGAVALVARDGKIVYHKAFGMADNQEGRELKKDDIFRIASQTKAITTTAVMMLWEEGKFRLDDPISKYIPEFKDVQIFDALNEEDSSFTGHPAENPITIRHLLTHTSGLGYGFLDTDEFRKMYSKAGIIDVFTTDAITIEENIRKLATLPLHQEPGTRWVYAEGLDVLGYFIEILSGQPLDEFFEERIFKPLGMKDTYFYLPDSKKDRLVPVQTRKDDQWVLFPANSFYDPEYPVKGAKMFFSGGAGLSSTAVDYANFLQMLLNQGELNGVRLLSRTTVQFMLENQVGDLLGDNGSYFCLGFEVLDQKGEARGGRGSAGTFGWGGYFNTQYFADPKEQLIGILMKQTQDIPSDDTGWKFSLLVGQAFDD